MLPGSKGVTTTPHRTQEAGPPAAWGYGTQASASLSASLVTRQAEGEERAWEVYLLGPSQDTQFAGTGVFSVR